jgi:heterodisulfide reductase subunit A-like polyferredoxin
MSDEHVALVIGGGIAGLQASLDLANFGFQVYIVEKETELGGTMRRLSRLFPTMQDAEKTLKPLLQQVSSNSSIKALTQAEVQNVQGSIGNFKVRVGRAGNSVSPTVQVEIPANVIIIATGLRQYDALKLAQYKYGQHQNVVTGLEYEAMCKSNGPTEGKILRSDNGQKPKSVAFILCAGSRDEKHLRYCCNLGCLNAIKHAHILREQYGKEVDIYVCYIDVRAVTKVGEQFYNKVRDEEVEFIHGQPSEVQQALDGTFTLDVYDQATSKLLAITADLVVLEMGLQPNVEIAQKLGLELTEEGFIAEKDPQLSVNETNVEGVFLAGAVQQPMHSYQAAVHASAAALKAISALRNR